VKKNNPLEKNLLICGDNLNALDDLIKKEIKVDLIYLDPPFFSNRHYEVIWGDEAEVRSFKDRWEGGINVYIEWMKERIVKMYDVLKDTGSFYLHCDPTASHYLKVLLDGIFGHEKFVNEIIWKRTNAKGLAFTRFAVNHDTLLRYSKSDKWTWNPAYTEHDPQYIEKFYKYVEPETGRKYTLDNLLNPNKDRPNLNYEFLGITRVWRWTKERMNEAYKKGIVIQSGPGRVPRLKRYLDEQEGTPVDDVWIDIKPIQSQAAERLGYPTQKPEGLLERIIKASSNKGDIVLDPFCGCGTAMAAAQKLGRKWIGIDISPTAIKLVQKRLEKLGAIEGKNYEAVGMPTTLSELRKLEPFEFQNWVINEMKAKQSKKLTSDFGLDGYYDKTIFTARAGIQVKQSENVGRNVVDNFETALSRGKFDKGFIVAFSFTRGAHEEAARAKGEGVDIRLIEAEALLLGKVKI
jgi:DNA modification methylase